MKYIELLIKLLLNRKTSTIMQKHATSKGTCWAGHATMSDLARRRSKRCNARHNYSDVAAGLATKFLTKGSGEVVEDLRELISKRVRNEVHFPADL